MKKKCFSAVFIAFIILTMFTTVSYASEKDVVDMETNGVNSSLDPVAIDDENIINGTTKGASKHGVTYVNIILSTSSFTYDGKAKSPGVTVKTDSGTVLKKGTDYNLNYYNNVNAGTATVEIVFIGSYNGTLTKNYTIKPASISSATISLAMNSFTYDGNAKSPSVTVKIKTMVLKQGKDYTCTYYNNTNAGTPSVVVTGMGNYTGSATKTFTINPASLPSFDFRLHSQYKYDGLEKKPEIYFTGARTNLKEGIDYTLSYSNNIEPGTATASVVGIGNYTGTRTKTFSIFKADQPMVVKFKTKRIKEKKLQKKAVKVKAVVVKNAEGKVTYRKRSFSPKFKVKKNGIVKVKKGTKKGYYTVAIIVTAKGNERYEAKTIWDYVTIKVR